MCTTPSTNLLSLVINRMVPHLQIDETSISWFTCWSTSHAMVLQKARGGLKPLKHKRFNALPISASNYSISDGQATRRVSSTARSSDMNCLGHVITRSSNHIVFVQSFLIWLLSHVSTRLFLLECFRTAVNRMDGATESRGFWGLSEQTIQTAGVPLYSMIVSQQDDFRSSNCRATLHSRFCTSRGTIERHLGANSSRNHVRYN